MFPLTTRPVNVPTDVILGCALVVTVPVNRVDDNVPVDVAKVNALFAPKFPPSLN